MVKNGQNLLQRQEFFFKWVDLRNRGVQLRLVLSKGRVSGSGYYGHYGETATVKSAYDQRNRELYFTRVVCCLLDRVSVSYKIGAPVDVVEREKWQNLLLSKIQIKGQVRGRV